MSILKPSVSVVMKTNTLLELMRNNYTVLSQQRDKMRREEFHSIIMVIYQSFKLIFHKIKSYYLAQRDKW